MSLKSWKRKFYPVPANKPKTALAAVQHSIRKFTGLTKKNQRKYRVWMDGNVLTDDHRYFAMHVTSCALCQLFDCVTCPIVRLLDDTCGDAYCDFLDGNVRPMLTLLRRIEKMLLEERAKRRKTKS